MKQRIIATILLIVTVLTTFAGCATYAFAAKKNFDNYVDVDVKALLDALHDIEIEEVKVDDVDFNPDDDREEIVRREIYNKMLTSLNAEGDVHKLTDAVIDDIYDMVEYNGYCTWDDYTFNYNMVTTTNTLTGSSDTDDTRAAKYAIVKALVDAGWNLGEKVKYEVTESLDNKRISENDTIVVSYDVKIVDGETVKSTTYENHINEKIAKGNQLFDMIYKYFGGIGKFDIDTKKDDEISYTEGTKTYTFTNVSVSHIVANEATADYITYEHTLEDEMEVTNAFDKNGKKVELTIPEEAKITYVVYPIAVIEAPAIDAKGIIKHVLNDDITTDSLDALKGNALVGELVDLYNKALDEFTPDNKDELDKAINDECALARKESLYDVVSVLNSAKDADGTTVANDILWYYNDKNPDNAVGTIYEVFNAISGENTENPKAISWADIREFMGGYVINLTNYKFGSRSAIALVQDIIDEYNSVYDKKGKNRDLSVYDSYTTTDIQHIDGVNRIDVADKIERLEEAKETEKRNKINAKIDAIVADETVAKAVVAEYVAKVEAKEDHAKVYANIAPYDILKYILLSDTLTEETISAYIEDLSDYVYGDETTKTKERRTFAAALAELVAEYKKTAASGYDTVTAVKDKANAVSTANEALQNAAKAVIEALGYTPEDGKNTFAYAIEKAVDYLTPETEDAKNTTWTALVNKYIELHGVDTLFVLDKKTETDSKEIIVNSSDTTRETFLKALLADTANAGSYKEILEGAYNKAAEGENPAVETGTTIWKALAALQAADKATLEANEDLSDTKTTVRNESIDNYVANVLSAVLKDKKGKTVEKSISEELTAGYYNYTINYKIAKYNSDVQSKLAEEIYKLINNDKIVKIDVNHEDYPTELINKFVNEVLMDEYKEEFYTGNSGKYTTGTYAGGVTEAQRNAYNKLVEMLAEAEAALSDTKTGVEGAPEVYLDVILSKAKLGLELTEAEQNYVDKTNAKDAASNDLSAAKKNITALKEDLADAEERLEIAKNQDTDKDYNIFDKWGDVIEINKEIKNLEKEIKAAQKEIDRKKDGLQVKFDNAVSAADAAGKAIIDALAEGYTVADDATVEAFRAAKAAYDAAKNAYSNHHTKLTSLEKAVTDAGEDADKKETAEKALNDYKTENGLDAATTAKSLSDARDAAEVEYNKYHTVFAYTLAEYDTVRKDYESAQSDYNLYYTKLVELEGAVDTAKADFDAKKTAYEEKKAEVEGKGEAATEDDKNAVLEAEKAMNDAEKAHNAAKTELTNYKTNKKITTETSTSIKDAYVEATNECFTYAYHHYNNSNVVKNEAEAAIEEIKYTGVEIDGVTYHLEDAVDANGQVIVYEKKSEAKKAGKEKGDVKDPGLKTIIAKAEVTTDGEAISNVDYYGNIDAFMAAKLGADWKSILETKAREQLNEQIRIYAVAGALTGKVSDFDGEHHNVVADGYTGEGYELVSYSAAIYGDEADIKGNLKHELSHEHENWSDEKLTRKVDKKEWKEYIERLDQVFVDNKTFRDYKKDVTRAVYNNQKEQVGENNIRVMCQLQNLVNYLLHSDIQENVYAAHDGEYVIATKDGKLAYFFVGYHFEDKDAE